MKLTVKSRTSVKKKEAEQARRRGEIPAIVYSYGKENEMIFVDATEFGTVLRNVKSGQLATTVFALNHDGKEFKAIVKDIQYDPISYKVIHLDFQELVKGKPVRVKVPIYCTGAADAPGVKLGGFLRQVIRSLLVECDPEKIPTEIQVSVKDLGPAQKKRLSDLAIPAGIRPLAAMNEVVAVVAKMKG